MRTAVRLAATAFLVLRPPAAPMHAQEATLKVLGQPLAAGDIRNTMEQPFFEAFASRTGLALAAEYVPLDASGISEADTLAALQSGRAQIAALRISRVGQQQPIFLGLDLVGLNTDYASGYRATNAYEPALDRWLQDKIGIKLLGAWPFGPEILFCRVPIATLADLGGLRVRVYDTASAAAVEHAAGVPVMLDFAATRQALSEGRVDCAIGNPVAAAGSGWQDAATHVLPAPFQLGINAYGMSLSAWRSLDSVQQGKLAAAFRSFTDEIWRRSEALSDDAMACLIGKAECAPARASHLTYVPVGGRDVAFLREILRRSSFPGWAESCDKADSGCSGLWKATIGPLVGME